MWDVGCSAASLLPRSSQPRRSAVTCAMVPLMQNTADSNPSSFATLASKAWIKSPSP